MFDTNIDERREWPSIFYVLLCANLFLVLALLSSEFGLRLTGLHDAFVYRAETVDLSHRLEVCEGRHRALTSAIRKEGLWKRLGMEGQPWLR